MDIYKIKFDIKDALKKSKWTIDSYRIAVDSYRNAQSKEEKKEMGSCRRLVAGGGRRWHQAE